MQEVEQRVVACFDAVRLCIFEHYNRILLCDWVPVYCSACLMDGVSCHNAFVLYLGSTCLGIDVLLFTSVAPVSLVSEQ